MSQKIKRRQKPAVSIRFTGKNAKDVLAFAKEFGGFDGTNGGSWLKVRTSEGFDFRVRKDEFVVIDADGSLRVYDADLYEELFFEVK